MSIKKTLFMTVSSLLLFCVLLFENGTQRQVEAAPLRVTPTPRPGYYKGSFDSSDTFIEWMKSPEAAAQNDGAYKHFIDECNEYGYLLIPYIEDTKPGVDYDTDGNVQYCFKADNQNINVQTMFLSDDKKQYVAKGIAQYVKDKWSNSDFNNEVEVTKYSPDYPYIKYLFSERKVDVGGEIVDCIVRRKTSVVTNVAGAQPLVTYGINFIYNGMVVYVDYYNSENEAAFFHIMKQLNFIEVVLNQENYNNTTASINHYIYNNTNVEESQKENNDDNSVKIIGKKKIRHGKSYTYQVKGKGLKKKVKWSVNRKKLAKISNSGKLKAIKKGTVKLTVKSGKIKCSIKIKIV